MKSILLKRRKQLIDDLFTDTDYFTLSSFFNFKEERKILLWGASPKSNWIFDLLKCLGVCVGGYIDSDVSKEYFNGLRVLHPSEISPNDHFVYVALEGYHEDVIKLLYKKNFRNRFDYLYPGKRQIVINKHNGYIYSDCSGNLLKGNVTGFSVGFSGCGLVVIGKNCDIDSSVQIYVENGGMVLIDDNCRIEENATIFAQNNSVVHIGKKSYFASQASLKAYDNSLIDISKGFSAGVNFKVAAPQASCCLIGRDCMFSCDVLVLSSTGHNLYSLIEKRNITGEDARQIIVGDHVWCGMDVKFLSGTCVGNGCVVGAGSLVNKEFPNNVILAGSPAGIVREGVAWDRSMYPFLDHEADFKIFDFRN